MKQQIEKAIAAHGAWKERLEGAIETGKIDIPVETIKVDNQCEFGKWLYGEGAAVAADHADRYAKVKELHMPQQGMLPSWLSVVRRTKPRMRSVATTMPPPLS